MVKTMEAVVVPPPGPGFVTLTLTLPAVETSLAGMFAVICVASDDITAGKNAGQAGHPRFVTTRTSTKLEGVGRRGPR